ncbi:MAG TPA: SlyX family protein [Agitococcus sp.]|uniref:SlyX family protein n=1 Tax=uncultured Agitococcus sp. TaxID=1506599 RepID=UPI00262ABCEF|nr:SlyX family protein [uncultured Agitococcus sp.]HMV59727.1 SlyX family protein [Agitococcus sp.]HNC02695.1 SlyX family protein [Agitococcus sp.]HNG10803.1 SlyX family protein [Agitococcus sp.]HNN28596.1 SlyX family protein [Agitococcus sp.]HRH91720.1 SlyX family protein [Agitococcus sp.]
MTELLAERVTELECKQAFQEDLLETLNKIVVEQQQHIDILQEQIKIIYQQLKSLQPSNIADLADEVPPPHY